MKKLFVLIVAISLVGIAYAQTNAPGGATPGIQKYYYESPTKSLLNCTDILIYTDDAYHPAPNNYADQALVNLGCTYTGFYNGNFTGFETALTTGTWDLVVFANDNYTPPTSVFDALNAYVLAGGRLICHSWIVNSNPLFTTLGLASFSPFGTTLPVYWWYPGNSLFNVPNVVPMLTGPFGGGSYGVDGFYVTALPGFNQLAGYTPTVSAGQEALLVGNGGRTIFQGFMDGLYIQDLNSNSKPDLVELYENMLTEVCQPPTPPVPLSNWAIYLGIFLIAAFIVFRFRRRLA